ncbi:MFS transporter [Salinispira pacifica]
MRNLLKRLGVNNTVLALSIARFGDSFGNSILFVVLPLFVAQLPAPLFPIPQSLRVGILISLFGLVNAFMQPIAGIIGDRIGKGKPLIMMGLACMSAGTLLFLLAGQYTHLLFMRALQGIGLALTVPASLSLMSRSTVKRTRGAAMGVYTTLRLIGFSIGPLMGGLLRDTVGFSASFYLGAAAIGVGFAVVLFLVHEPSAEESPAAQERAAEAQADGRNPEDDHPSGSFFDRSLFTPSILSAAFGVFAMASAFTMIVTLENEINARINQSAFVFGIVFSSLMVSRLIFQVPLGRLSDRIGRKKLIIGGLIVMIPGTALIGLAHSTAVLVLLRVLQGLGSAGIAAPTFALVGDSARSGGEGRQTSIVTTGFGLGLACGPLIAGALATVSFQLPFYVGGAILLLAAVVAGSFITETVHREPAAQTA